MLETVLEGALVDGVGGVSHETVSVRLVLAEPALEVRPIPVKYLPVALLHTVAVHPHEAISVAVDDLSRAVHYASLPYPLDPHLSRKEEVSSLAVPKIVLPLAFIYLPCGRVVVYSKAVLHLVDEGALVLVATAVEVAPLDERGCVDCLTLETVSVGVLDEGRISDHR